MKIKIKEKIKVSILDIKLIKNFLSIVGLLGGIYTYITIFKEVPKSIKNNWWAVLIVTLILIAIYVILWVMANKSKQATLNINGSQLQIKVGNIFKQNDFKVIPFNEFFDTKVDDKIISKTSLNGLFIETELKESVENLDRHIENYLDNRNIEGVQSVIRDNGKNVKYPLGTICKYNDFLITAFSKFDSNNRAYLNMKDYIDFLMRFWEEIDIIYAGKSVSIPVFGSGITRFKENIGISDQELLEIIIWSFKISRVKIKYPSKVSIIIYNDNVDKINFYKLKELE